ncbi:MAG: hypothetical protein HC802_11865 [Caldilineaceae bacterium]|nr:hypothetical protein [Caldilineaceae bacterium]
MYWVVLRGRRTPWLPSLGRLALLVALGTGLSVNNSRAVFEAVTGRRSEFKRTPKFAVTTQPADWQVSDYALPKDPTFWIELLLATYASALLAYSVVHAIWWMFFWLLLYVGGYGYIAYLAFTQARQLQVARTRLGENAPVIGIS